MTKTDLKCGLLNAFFHFEINGYPVEDLYYFKNKLEKFPKLWKFALDFYKKLNFDTHKLYLILISTERN